MALNDLRRVLHHRGDPGKNISHNRHADKSCDRHANLHRVDVGVITHDNAGLFHALDPLYHGWRGEAHASSQLSVREPPVDLQFLQQLPADLIEQLVCS